LIGMGIGIDAPTRRVGQLPLQENSMDQLQQLAETIESVRDDYEKGKSGNKAAGTRVRKAMQEVKNIAQAIRQEMLESREEAPSS